MFLFARIVPAVSPPRGMYYKCNLWNAVSRQKQVYKKAGKFSLPAFLFSPIKCRLFLDRRLFHDDRVFISGAEILVLVDRALQGNNVTNRRQVLRCRNQFVRTE